MVLDAACGKGRVTIELSKTFRVIACDISKEMITFINSLTLPKVTTVLADVDNLPFSENTFDAIVCFEAFVHFLDIDKTLHEFYRVLKPNGMFIFNIDNSYGAIRILKESINFFACIFDDEYRKERVARKEIYRTLSPLYIKKKIIASNFIYIKKYYTGLILPFSLKHTVILPEKLYSIFSPLDKMLLKIPFICSLGTYAFFVCKKPL